MDDFRFEVYHLFEFVKLIELVSNSTVSDEISRFYYKSKVNYNKGFTIT